MLTDRGDLFEFERTYRSCAEVAVETVFIQELEVVQVVLSVSF